MEAWTNVYACLKKATETTAPVLSRALVRDCDLSQTAGLAGGYFDGPLAWRMVLHELFPKERTEADKQFYRAAERIQLASPLTDGCSAAEYSRRALAFLVHICPYMPQAWSADDITAYLINLMPKNLRVDGRRITTELKVEGLS